MSPENFDITDNDNQLYNNKENNNLKLIKKYKLFDSRNVLAPCTVTYDENDKKQLSNLPKNFKQLVKSKPMMAEHNHFQVVINTDYIVLDLDVGDDYEGYKWFLMNGLDINEFETLITKTPSGGYHVYFAITQYCKERIDLIKKVNSLKIGVEVKHDSYVLEGENYHILSFCEFDDLYEIPDNIVNLLIRATKVKNPYRDVSIDEIIPIEPKSDKSAVKSSKISIEECKEILDNLSPERCDVYNSWQKITSAIVNEFGKTDEAYNLWNDWSKTSESYDSANNNATWKYLSPKSNGAKSGTLYMMLKEDNIDVFNEIQRLKKAKKSKKAKSEKTDLLNVENSDLPNLYDYPVDIPKENVFYNQIRLYHKYYKDYEFTYETFFNFLAQRIRFFESKNAWIITDQCLDPKQSAFTSNYTFVKKIFNGYSESNPEFKIYLKGDKFCEKPLSWKNEPMDECNMGSYGILDLYKKYLYIDVFDYMPFSPISKKMNNENFILNSYKDRFGQKFYNENLVVDESKIENIICHIREIICNGDLDLFKYILGWIASIIQNPAKKTEVALILYSKPNGSGKSFFFNILSKIINNSVSCTMEKVVTKFNSLGCEKLLINLEEIEKGATNKSVETLKDMMTRSTMYLEKKGFEAVEIKDCTNYILCTNNINCLRIEEFDRRYVVCDVNCSKVGDFAYFEQLHNDLENLDIIEQLYNYFIRYDLSNFQIRKIHKSALKEDMKQLYENCFDAFVKELKEEVENGFYEEDKNFVHKSHLYPKYKAYREENFKSEHELNKARFNILMTQKFGPAVKKNGGIFKYNLAVGI